MMEKFEEMNVNDDRLKDIKLALITAQCSRSGVTNPVSFIVSEGEGNRLQLLRRLTGSPAQIRSF